MSTGCQKAKKTDQPTERSTDSKIDRVPGRQTEWQYDRIKGQLKSPLLFL